MICVLGDAHLDVIVGVDWPLAEETDTPALTRLSVGGQAANVAAWASALGSPSRLITARASDPAERLVTGWLTGLGVQLLGPVKAGRTGVVVSLSDGGRRRSMLTDRGVGTELAAADLREEWLDGCDWLHLPAYGFAREPIRGAARAAVAAARARSVRLSVDLSSTALIESLGVESVRGLIADLAPDVIFGTQAEAALIAGVMDQRVIVKLGAGGVLAEGRYHPALPAEAVDSTGAGDAFAAGYLLGGVRLGLSAAARAVARMGAMP